MLLKGSASNPCFPQQLYDVAHRQGPSDYFVLETLFLISGRYEILVSLGACSDLQTSHPNVTRKGCYKKSEQQQPMPAPTLTGCTLISRTKKTSYALFASVAVCNEGATDRTCLLFRKNVQHPATVQKKRSIYICMCMYIYIYIAMCTHRFVCIYRYIRMYIYTYTCISIYVYIHIGVCICIHICNHICMCIYTYV